MRKRKKIKRQQLQPELQQSSDIWAWILVGAIILLVAAIRIHLRQVPLERDEGEYAYAGQLMLKGIPPYKLAYNMKLPGAYAAYATIMSLFGQTVTGIHVGLLLVNAVTIVLIFLLAKRLFGQVAGVVAAACYAMLSVSPSVFGFAAHATNFVVLPAIAAVILLLAATESGKLWKYLFSGLLFGTAFLMKQHGVFFIVFGLFYLIWTELHNRPASARSAARLGIFAAGVILPFALTCMLLYRAGVFKTFWFWTFSYASQYASEVSMSDAIVMFEQGSARVMGAAYLIWAWAAVGLVLLFWDRKMRPRAVFGSAFFVCSVLTIVPSLRFYPHYFVTLLPAVALLAGVAAASMALWLSRMQWGSVSKAVPIAALVVVLAITVGSQSSLLFDLSPVELSKAIYHQNPFPESVQIAKYIREHTTSDDRIAVIGSEPQIYFYSHRLSTTGYIYTYGLMEDQQYALTMQKEMIHEIESGKPKFMVFVNVRTSWLVMPESSKLIFNWYERYSSEHYIPVGLVNIAETGTDYYWDKDAVRHFPTSDSFVYVLKRKGAPKVKPDVQG